MVERKSVAEMVGEFFREVAVLVGVFGLLDEAIAEHPVRAWWFGATLATMSVFGAAGMAVERYRSKS